MKPAVGRLILTVALFAGWLGYLGYLVVCRPHTPDGRPLTLSRPQFLVSMLDVIAQVDDAKGDEVIVDEVLSPRENPPLKAGDKIQVENIEKCRPLPGPLDKGKPTPPDWTGAGQKYILPLQIVERNGKRHFEVVPTPPSPGYPPHSLNAGPPRIYPATPQMLAEYHDIRRVPG
jgi:hypothetical protein